MRKIVGELRAWGDFIIKHMNFADEHGESILSRYIEYGYTDSTPATDKILCPDMPTRLQRINIAVNRLSEPQRVAVTLHYCAPVKEDGRVHTLSDLVMLAREHYPEVEIHNKGRFRAELRKGIDSLERVKK